MCSKFIMQNGALILLGILKTTNKVENNLKMSEARMLLDPVFTCHPDQWPFHFAFPTFFHGPQQQILKYARLVYHQIKH